MTKNRFSKLAALTQGAALVGMGMASVTACVAHAEMRSGGPAAVNAPPPPAPPPPPVTGSAPSTSTTGATATANAPATPSPATPSPSTPATPVVTPAPAPAPPAPATGGVVAPGQLNAISPSAQDAGAASTSPKRDAGAPFKGGPVNAVHPERDGAEAPKPVFPKPNALPPGGQ